MKQPFSSQQKLAYDRIHQRRQRAARRRRRQRRMTMLAACIAAVLVCATAVHFLLPRQAPAEDPAPTGEGTGQTLTGDPYAHVDLSPQEGDSEQMLALKELAATQPAAKKIIDNIDAYPEELILLVLKNSETVEYVANYPENSQRSHTIDLSKEASSSTIPLLLQWDERWGYCQYGSGLIGWTGCGPTCLSMLALYLTGNESYDPATIASWAEENGYYASGSGTSWTLMSEGCAHFGLRAEELPLVKQYMLNALEEGRPIVCAMGPGDFTDNGHYIILTGYDEDEGFTVNDPNSRIRSGQHWTYEQLEGQISNLWAFSKA